MNKFKDMAIGLLCLVLLGGILWYGYDKYQEEKESVNTTEEISTKIEIPTLEQRVNEWNEEKHSNALYNLCMELPEEIVKTIINRIGTTATYIEIAEEYLRNTNYYISMQIKDNMPDINGPDAKNAKVEIKTEVTRDTSDKDKLYKVPVIVKDSVK